MSSVIIQEAGKPDRIFHITQKETIIGRGADADIALPHITVSREHAKIIHPTEDEVYVENVNTQEIWSMVKKNFVLGYIRKIGSNYGKYTLVYFPLN